MKQLLYGAGLAGWMLCASACGARPSSSTAEADADTLRTERSFELPQVPDVLTNPEDRLDYVVTHYWDRFDFRDTAYIHLPDVTEQALVNYLDLLTRVQPAQADSAFAGMLRSAQAEPVMYHYMAENIRRYLYDPNSPMRNEDLYASAARYLAQHPEADFAAQSRAVHDLKLVGMNRAGSPATNFNYTLRNGRRGSLATLQTSVPVLLVFYNPDCESCVETIGQMSQSTALADAVANGRLTVLAVYTEGDADIWNSHAGQLPKGWIDAQDPSHVILDQELYDLTAMPTLYLLDARKRVVVKDASPEQVERFVSQNP